MRGTTKITGEVILCGLPRREMLKRYLLPNMIENLRVYRVPWADKYGDNKIIPAKELLSHGWWLYCSNCGTQVYDDEATVLTEETVLCAECAKDWSEKRGKK